MAEYFFSNYSSRVGWPHAMQIRPVANTALLRSSLSFGTQTIARPGGYWALSLTWRNVYGDQLRELEAMLTLLNGAEHSMNFHLGTLGHSSRGAWSGSPVVDGGSQTGDTLAVRSADTSVTDWAKAGDYFRTNQGKMLHMVLADADSDVSGDVSLSIWPELRGSPPDGDAVADNQAGQFRLVDVVEYSATASNKVPSGESISTITASFVDTATST